MRARLLSVVAADSNFSLMITLYALPHCKQFSIAWYISRCYFWIYRVTFFLGPCVCNLEETVSLRGIMWLESYSWIFSCDVRVLLSIDYGGWFIFQGEF